MRRAQPQLTRPEEQARETLKTALAVVRAWTKANSGLPPLIMKEKIRDVKMREGEMEEG